MNRLTGQVSEGQSPFSEPPVPLNSGKPELIHRGSIYPLLARHRDMKANLRAENKKENVRTKSWKVLHARQKVFRLSLASDWGVVESRNKT